MTIIQSAYEGVGLGFSIAGLTLVVPLLFLFKQYFRFLDHLQFVFLYWGILAPVYTTFGSFLSASWSKFIPNFLNFCTANDFVCTSGFALSFTICLLGAIILLFLIVTFQKCRKPQLVFQPVYSTFKGFFRWAYMPLVCLSTQFLFADINSGTTSSNFIPSVIIFAWTIVFPIIQLIVYKCIQRQDDNIWIKWIEFAGYFRIFSITLVLTLGRVLLNQIPKYFAYGPLVLYAGLYLWKNNYTYKIVERVLFGLGQALAITIFSLYLFSVDNVVLYDLDFFALAIILLLDITFYTIKFISWLKYGKVSIDKINPEQSAEVIIQPQHKRETKTKNKNYDVVQIDDDFKLKKKNKYQGSQESINLQNSRDSLNGSIVKGNSRRRK